jgi:hypothetical protein
MRNPRASRIMKSMPFHYPTTTPIEHDHRIAKDVGKVLKTCAVSDVVEW